jgi:dihydrofolate synthase/folylpolyglutamate synthase
MRWLSGFEKYGWVFGLERISTLMEKLGDPQKELKVVHVAGTNGKGSVCHFISSILQQAGYSVGLYVSPHLERFSERIVVNGDEISDDDIQETIELVRPFVEEMRKQGTAPTFFEIVTAVALLYFQKRKVDYAVVEVGLGGRLDATNIVHPLVSVITNISLEHTDILGDSLEKIAFEKAGIIKEHVPVVTATTGVAQDVIAHVAKEHNAPVVFVEETWWKRVLWDGREQEFFVQGSLGEFTVRTSLLGIHQGENITVSIAAVEQLQMHGVFLTEFDIVKGIEVATNPGRMEIVSDTPLILLDGAHNPGGIKVLAETLSQDFTYKHLFLVFGVFKDKDIPPMVAMLVPIADSIIVTRSSSPRAYDPMLLKGQVTAVDPSKEVVVTTSVPEAIDYARRHARRKDLICITGSLFTVGEARQYLLSRSKKKSS